jgi:hypothetical protein
MFLLEISFDLRSENRREFNSSLDSLMREKGSGSIRSSVFEDRDDRNRILMVLEWGNIVDLQRYLVSETLGVLLGCLKTLGTVSDCRIVDLTVPDGAIGTRAAARWVKGEDVSDPRT